MQPLPRRCIHRKMHALGSFDYLTLESFIVVPQESLSRGFDASWINLKPECATYAQSWEFGPLWLPYAPS